MVSSSKDHPRSRGEYFVLVAVVCQEVGSSPLSRGILDLLLAPKRPRRIIPALAGNTTRRPRTAPWGGDHPRSRGEYEGLSCQLSVRVGSSPLSRGILRPRLILVIREGIIPALAGNTTTSRPWTRSRGDHPRSRGEYQAMRIQWNRAGGSSPLSRGILRRVFLGLLRGWIIPALAGNTRSPTGRRPRGPDHPRSRGEYTWV